MSNIFRIVLACLVLVMALLIGCKDDPADPDPDPVQTESGEASWKLSGDYHHSLDLSVGGVISLATDAGDAEFVAWVDRIDLEFNDGDDSPAEPGGDGEPFVGISAESQFSVVGSPMGERIESGPGMISSIIKEDSLYPAILPTSYTSLGQVEELPAAG